METSSETIADIVREMYYSYEGLIAFEFQWYADRIETAHKREVAELRECLRQALHEFSRCSRPCSECYIGRADNKCKRWRKALEGANDGNVDDIIAETRPEYGSKPLHGIDYDLGDYYPGLYARASKNACTLSDLRRRLKIAEDALDKLQTICKQTEYSYGRSICDDALAAIREKGGER